MIGPKTTDTALFVGAARLSAAADTSAVTVLNGRTVVVAQGAEAQAAVERAAEQAGGLIEFVAAPPEALPFDADTFDLVSTAELADWPADQRLPRLHEAVRVLRPGGRIILMIGGTSPGLLGRFSRQPTLDAETVINLLARTGLAACRRLAEAEDVEYYEGRKARTI